MRRVAQASGVLLFALLSCATNRDPHTIWDDRYQQLSPSIEGRAVRPFVVYYYNYGIDDIYSVLFSDYLILGKTEFTGGLLDRRLEDEYTETQNIIPLATKKGADVVLYTAVFKDTINVRSFLSLPSSTTSNFSAWIGSSLVQGSVTTPSTTVVPFSYSQDRYEQSIYFLQRMDDRKPIWEQRGDDYAKDGTSDFDGDWVDNKADIFVYRSGESIVAATTSVTDKGLSKWNQGDLRFVFNVNTNAGIYILDNKTPTPCRFQIDRFGLLRAVLPYIGGEGYGYRRKR